MNPQIGFLLNKSLESLRGSNLDSAELYLKQALRLQSTNPHVLRLLGVIAAQRKQYPEALNYLNSSIRSLPRNALALSNLGNVYLELKDYSSALASYDKSIKIDSKYEEAWSNKGNALYELKQFEEALVHHERAIALNPNYAEAYTNKGNALNRLKRFKEALDYHDRALSLKLNYVEAYTNKGVTLNELKRFDEAIAHYDKALSINPDYVEAYTNKAIILMELKRYADAVLQYRKALGLKPEIDWMAGNLLHTEMIICSWSDFEERLKVLVGKIQQDEKVASPFNLLSLSDNNLLHQQASTIYSQALYPPNNELGPIDKHSRQDKIRVGYFSADFKNHAVAILTAELFELHDKNQFEIIAFSYGADDKSLMRARLNQAFDQFIDVSAMTDVEIATLARELQIDIAVDLGGYTAESRPGIFAYRSAPMQVSYIGYLGTMGASYMDYLVADHTIVPQGSEKYYSEKIVYLPSYQVNDRTRMISDKQFTRQELGLPETGFVFCCFNNNYKILPATFDSWMRILKAVEGSVLFLYAQNQWAEDNLKKEALARGVDSARLVFGKTIPTDEYLARYRVCDLFLDTLPYNAGTIASDALWAVLPVLTLMGQSFASRMAASLLQAIGLPDLITSSCQEYEALAINLAMQPEKLGAIREALMKNRLTTPLFDTPVFTKNLEKAYIKMYEQYQADLQPEQITIV